MPITYDKATDIWNLTDPTEDEKNSLLKIASDEIVGFFGELVAQRVMDLAKDHFKAQGGKDIGEELGEGLEEMNKENMFNA